MLERGLRSEFTICLRVYTCKVKFISEYAEIVVIGGNCMIFDIEGHSIYKVVL